MNGYLLTVFVVSALSIGAFGVWLRRTRIRHLGNVDDSEYLKHIPESVSEEIWLESRREIAQIWKLPPEKLNPEMPLKTFGQHFSVLGDSGIDFDTIEEQLSKLGLSAVEADKIATIGELLKLYSVVIKKRR